MEGREESPLIGRYRKEKKLQKYLFGLFIINFYMDLSSAWREEML
jgi:hypothetical protein